MAGLKDIIDHNLVLILEVLQVAAGCDDPLEGQDRHTVLVLVGREIVLELQVEESLLLELVEVEGPLFLGTFSD